MSEICWQYVNFKRGKKLRKDGKPCPPKPHDDAADTEPGFFEWIGYRTEMAQEHARACKVAEMLNCPKPEFTA